MDALSWPIADDGDVAAPQPLISTARLLTLGGDDRIAVDPVTGVNRYLCPSTPTAATGFGSCTASIVSSAAFAAAERLRRRLMVRAATEDAADLYARELRRIEADLLRLCHLEALPGLRTVFAASGTDIHLLAAQLIGGLSSHPTTAILVEASETGSGVGLAVSGRHFSTRTARGTPVSVGAAVGGRGVEALVAVAARAADGAPRPPAAVRRDLERAVLALAPGTRVLITVADVSKTGLLSLDLAAVLDLRRRFPDRIEVLIDACQFRLSPASLRAYLEHEVLVAVTGSKFLGGPPFCGALLVPPGLARRFAGQTLSPGLSAYGVAADLPADWVGAAALPRAANYGLLLRWEAALAELRAFSAVPDWKVARILQAFAATARAGLAAHPALEALATPQLDRRALGPGRWDSVQSIFPVLLRHPGDGGYFSPAETEGVYRALAGPGGAGLRLGQPVACGARDGAPISALRLCASARLVVEATHAATGGLAAVLDQVSAACDRVAAAAGAVSATRRASAA